jgi:hypothetical protein
MVPYQQASAITPVSLLLLLHLMPILSPLMLTLICIYLGRCRVVLPLLLLSLPPQGGAEADAARSRSGVLWRHQPAAGDSP